MRVATMLAVVMLVMLNPGRARAQTIEVGAGSAVSCKSVGYGFCTYNWGRADAVHVSWWKTPSLVVEARAARLDGPNTRVVAVTEQTGPNSYFSRSYMLRDERRRLLQASMLYHFRPQSPARPFLGGGLGSLWWRGDAFCESTRIGCERGLPAGVPGVRREQEWVASFAGGLAVHAGRNTIVRGGVRDTVMLSAFWPGSDDSKRRRSVYDQLPEYFLSIGYRW